MDSFFGVGLPELALIIILATIVLGPQRMRQLARQLGRWTTQLQNLTRAFTEQLNSELDEAERAELKGAKDDIQTLQRQLSDLRREFVNVARDTNRDVKNTIGPNIEEIRRAVHPERATENDAEKESAAPSNQNEIDLPQPIEVPDDPE